MENCGDDMPKFRNDENEFLLKISESKDGRYKMSVPKVLMERLPKYEKGVFQLYKDKNEIKLSIGLPIPYEELSKEELYLKMIGVLRNYLAHKISPDNSFVELFNIYDRLQLKYQDEKIENYAEIIYGINEPEEYRNIERKDIINLLNFIKYELIEMQSSSDSIKKKVKIDEARLGISH